MRRQRDASRADLVELRLDLLDRPDADAALAGRSRPVIATCRAAWEGGRFQGSEAERLAILTRALALGADYVDLEWKAAAALEHWPAEARARVVLSSHDFEGVPADLADRVRDMRRHGTAVVKVAVTAKTLRDALPVIAVGRAGRDAGQRTVVIAMGTPGLATRVLPEHVGSCWTYGGNGVAPGQVTVDRLRDEFRVGRVGASTPVYAVVGRPIGHSVSPAMHNAAFAATGVDGVYIPCEASDFDDFLALADALGIAGASVTAPFKEDAARTAGAGRRAQHAAAPRRRVGRDQHRRRRLPRAAGRGDARGPARRDRRRRRIGALGRPRPRVARGPGVGARPAARGGAGAGRRRAGGGGRVAGAARQLGSARQHDAGRHASRRRSIAGRRRRDPRRRAGLRPRLQPAADAAAARRRGRRLPHPRRPRHARRAGRPPVRVVDRRDAGGACPPRGCGRAAGGNGRPTRGARTEAGTSV